MAPKKNFNSEYMSLYQAKCIQAICAFLIIIHHISLKLCDPTSVPQECLKHGLEPFMYIGYLAVGVFFFYSGYGLYRSLHEKEYYLKDFFFNRLTPILIAHLLVSFTFMVISNLQDIPISVQGPFTLFGPNTTNPYSWYIYAIIICYFLFYITYRFVKNESLAITIIVAGLVLYVLFCNYWLYGGWWYNTILVFAVGIVYARRESLFYGLMEAHYIRCIVGTVFGVIIGFALSEGLSNMHVQTDFLIGYSLGELVIAMLRTLTSTAFVLLIVLISMNVKIKSKILYFIGGFTLEIYLVHGIFVQVFASEYLSGYDISVCYISNPVLYTLLVLLLTLVTAYLLHIINQGLFTWIKKELKGLYGKSVYIAIGILLVSAILITIKTYREDQMVSAERADSFAQFSADQSYINISDGKMAYYTQGDGEHTILILGSINDPSSELVMRYLAKFLSHEYRVCIFDYLGRGFSDDAVTERTALNIANELHEAVGLLNMDDKYILMPCDYSGLYALKYLEMYPDEVEGLIGVDMMLPSQYDIVVKSSGLGVTAYDEAMSKALKQENIWRRLEASLGYSRWMFYVYEPLWRSPSLEDYMPMIEEVYVRNRHRDTVITEQRLAGPSSMQIGMNKLPDNLPAIMIVDYVTSRGKIGKTSYISTYYDFISNPGIQSVRITQGDPMFMYYQGKYFAQMINEFIHTIWP